MSIKKPALQRWVEGIAIGLIVTVVGGLIVWGLQSAFQGGSTSEPSVTPASPASIAKPSASESAVPSPEPLKNGEILSTLCSTDTRRISRGLAFDVTYRVKATRSGTVGLGAGVYDGAGHDYARGDGDVSQHVLPAGDAIITRSVVVADNAPMGRYEVVAELWPTDKIGQEGVEVLLRGEATCGTVTVG